MRILLFVLILWCFASAHATNPEPLRDASKLIAANPEAAARVANVRVTIADYDLLRRDFRQLRGMTDGQIDAALVAAAGAVALGQTRPNDVNTPISLTGEQITVLRPRGYGRALVFPFLDGFLDGKGAGTYAPEQKSHRTGLASLNECLREFLFEKMVSLVLQVGGYKPGTVGTYAVLDFGFDIVDEAGNHRPAGLVLRQAHERENGQGILTSAVAEKVERLLRSFGIISDYEAMRYEYQTIDRRNVQGSKWGSILDFGAMKVLGRFSKLNSSPVQPDPERAVPGELWGPTSEAEGSPFLRDDQIGVDLEPLVRGWRDGKIGRSDISAFFQSRFAPIRSHFARFSCRNVFAGN